jgi:EAL domain-containing protein (putative c-di-GMP-specific phosphodiesterase class I)
VFFIVLFISGPIRKRLVRDRYASILSKTYNYRVFTIDFNLNKVVYFDKKNPRNLKTSDIEYFLKQYRDEDLYRVKGWLMQLLDEKTNTPWHLEAQAMIRVSNRVYFSVLEVTKVVYETKIIHLNSYLLQYLSPHRGPLRKHQFNVIDIEEATHRLHKSQANRGATYVIRFFYKKYQGNTGNYISPIFLKKLKDKITNFLGPGLFLVEQEEPEIILLEMKNITANEHRQIAHSIAHTIVRSLEVSGLKDEVSFTVGVVENKYFPHQFDALIDHARLMAGQAEKDAVMVAIYDQNQNYTEITAKAIDLEVVDIIKSRKYTIAYQPILSLDNYYVSAYMVSTAINSSLTADIMKLCQMAGDSTDCRELLSSVAKQILIDFTNDRPSPDQAIFFPVSVYANTFILKSLAMMKRAKEANIILVFDEVEIHDWGSNFEIIAQMMKSYHDRGMKTALNFSNCHLLLNNDIYVLFDYYILDHQVTGDIVADNRQRVDVHGLIETLKKFKRPIVAIGMPDLESVELLASFEVEGVASDAIAPAATKLPRIDSKTKTITRIRQFEATNKK